MGMNTSFALITVILCLPQVAPEDPDASVTDIMAEARRCQQQHGLTDEEFQTIMKEKSLPKEEPIESRRCFVECVLTAEHLLKEGKLNEDNVLKFSQNLITDGAGPDEQSIKNGISACRSKGGKGRCTDGYSAWVCVLEFLENYEE